MRLYWIICKVYRPNSLSFFLLFFSPLVQYASVNLISDFHNYFENYKYLFYETLWKVIASQALQRDAEKKSFIKSH